MRLRQDWFDSQLDLDPERLVFIDGPKDGGSTNMARRHGRSARGERLRVGVPHGHVWTPHRMQEESLVQAAARDRVLPCVRPLLRPFDGRGPVWEFEDQVQIIGTRSKRSPCAWFS